MDLKRSFDFLLTDQSTEAIEVHHVTRATLVALRQSPLVRTSGGLQRSPLSGVTGSSENSNAQSINHVDGIYKQIRCYSLITDSNITWFLPEITKHKMAIEVAKRSGIRGDDAAPITS